MIAPIAFGIIFLVGFMNREFTAYAVSALLVIEALQGRLWHVDNLRQKGVVAARVRGGMAARGLLRTGADAMGPGTAGMSNPHASNVSVAVGFLCPDVDLTRVGANLSSLVTTQMGPSSGSLRSDSGTSTSTARRARGNRACGPCSVSSWPQPRAVSRG